MHPSDHTNAPTTRGPITQVFNGRGVRPWLPELVCEPGSVYRVAEAMTMYRPQGPARRVCWWNGTRRRRIPMIGARGASGRLESGRRPSETTSPERGMAGPPGRV